MGVDVISTTGAGAGVTVVRAGGSSEHPQVQEWRRAAASSCCFLGFASGLNVLAIILAIAAPVLPWFVGESRICTSINFLGYCLNTATAKYTVTGLSVAVEADYYGGTEKAQGAHIGVTGSAIVFIGAIFVIISSINALLATCRVSSFANTGVLPPAPSAGECSSCCFPSMPAVNGWGELTLARVLQ